MIGATIRYGGGAGVFPLSNFFLFHKGDGKRFFTEVGGSRGNLESVGTRKRNTGPTSTGH